MNFNAIRINNSNKVIPKVLELANSELTTRTPPPLPTSSRLRCLRPKTILQDDCNKKKNDGDHHDHIHH